MASFFRAGSFVHFYIQSVEKIPKDGMLCEQLRQQKLNNAEEDGPSWRDKPLHGMYHHQTEEVADVRKSYQWPEKAGLKDGKR